MRGKYEKGIITYEQILSRAKGLARENGFNKLRVSDICRSLNIKLGTFTYYFQTKTNLASEICSDLLMQCFHLIRSNPTVPMDMLQVSITADFFYYAAIFLKEDASRFYLEVMDTPLWHIDFTSEKFADFYDIYNADYHLGLAHEKMPDFLHVDLAIRREFFTIMHNEYKTNLTEDIVIQYVRKIHGYVYRAMGIDPDIIQQYDDWGEMLLKKVDYSSLDLFKDGTLD